MSFRREGINNARAASGNAGKPDGKTPNGNRNTFRTDTAISNSRGGAERTLKRWQPDSNDTFDGSLENTPNSGKWDQFAANTSLFGLKSDYDEELYTTSIDRNDPKYKQKAAAADKLARDIEKTKPVSAHVAEERQMDYTGNGGDDQEDEEDKYSGVRRQDFPPLGNRENRYTPPARRAPTGAATVSGAPVDPAIITAQLRSNPVRQQSGSKTEEQKAATPEPAKTQAPKPSATADKASTPVNKVEPKTADIKPTETSKVDSKPAEPKAVEKGATPLRPSATTSRTVSPAVKDAPAVPSATSTVERDVLNSFKTFATQQRLNADKARNAKAKADKEVKLIELKKFAESFKLATPVPKDLVSIIAKDPEKQKTIQAKALANAADIAKAKATDASKEKDKTTIGDSQSKRPGELPAGPAQPSAGDSRSATRPTAQQQISAPSGVGNSRQTSGRQFNQPQNYNQQYRNGRQPPHMVQQNQTTGNLSQRLRNVEQQKQMQAAQHHAQFVQHGGYPDMRLPPTGPANATDPNFGRRMSGLTPAHLANKLNPNSNEFRPSPFATAFNPTAPSAGSSPRSALNHTTPEVNGPAPGMQGQLIRRKTKAVSITKCYILGHLKSIQPPPGKNWDENDGLRPAFETPPTWRQLVEETENPESTLHMTYKEYFEKLPLAGAAIATPNVQVAVPQMAHQHQLPFHLQHGGQGMPPRQSPHGPPMQMQPGQASMPQTPYHNADDHRMMHSNSAHSYAASPRMAQVQMAYPPSIGASPGQIPYAPQGVMPQYMGPGAPQMGQYRSFSNNPQFMAQQSPHMGGQLMLQPPFMAGPNGMVAPNQQVPMYPGQTQYLPQGAPPVPPAMAGSNGYPSPGRPAAPMMVSQGSQQSHGQPAMYGMSPGVQYQQPMYAPQQPGQVGNMRGYINPGYGPQQQQYGTSPGQSPSHFTAQQRNNSNGYVNKHHQAHNAGQNQQIPGAPRGQGRTPDASEEGK